MYPLTVPKVSKESPKLLIEELEEEYGVSKDWCSDVKNRLKKAKCHLKTEYRVHCRDEDSLCADHWRKFILSDPVDEDFNHQCVHDHLSKCDSCEELKTVLQSVAGKIN